MCKRFESCLWSVSSRAAGFNFSYFVACPPSCVFGSRASMFPPEPAQREASTGTLPVSRIHSVANSDSDPMVQQSSVACVSKFVHSPSTSNNEESRHNNSVRPTRFFEHEKNSARSCRSCRILLKCRFLKYFIFNRFVFEFILVLCAGFPSNQIIFVAPTFVIWLYLTTQRIDLRNNACALYQRYPRVTHCYMRHPGTAPVQVHTCSSAV